MASSQFWRELATQFQNIPDDSGMLRADGHYVVGSNLPWDWRLAGSSTDFVRSCFETLARRGAAEIASIGAPDLLTVWLEELRKEQLHFKPFSGVSIDGGKETQHLGGIIKRPCEASATLCKQFEAKAVQAEFEEKQRNDPKNWSQFHREYEAHKSLKEIISEPPEQISEDWVRNTIARIQGIKPEEVTRKQIAFEVAGLLMSTRRRIEMISTAPAQEQPLVETVGENAKGNITPESLSTQVEPIAAQIQRLRVECKWTEEKLAEKTGLNVRTVRRHLSGSTIPHLGNIAAYEKAFSKALKKEVVITKMP